jgi:hypothetical protein
VRISREKTLFTGWVVNKSLWKGVWGRTFLQKGFPQPSET